MKKALVYFSDIEPKQTSNWITLLQSFEKEYWKISINLDSGEVFCTQIVSISNGVLLLKNPTTNQPLLNVLDNAIQGSNAPNNEILNTINALLRKHKKIIEAERKTKKTSKHTGRPIENYLRRATKKIIKRIGLGGKVKPIAEEIFFLYRKQAQSQKSFVAQVQRLYRDTKDAWKKETKISGVSFEEFAKNYLKASRRLYKTRAKTTSRK
ncbi:MAG: hypothetical protein ACR2J3_02540 [Aridibacter sp.]